MDLLVGRGELPEHAVQGSWMQERHLGVRARSRRRVDELGLGGGELGQVAGQVVASGSIRGAAPSPRTARKRPTPLSRVGRLDQLEAGGRPGAGRQEQEASVLRGELDHLPLRLEAEQRAIARERRLDAAHHDRDVVDGPDGHRSVGHARCSPHTDAKRVADLAERDACLDRGPHPREQVLGPRRGARQRCDGPVRCGWLAAGTQRPRARDLSRLGLHVYDLWRRPLLVAALGEGVDPHHDPLAGLEGALGGIRCIPDLVLLVAVGQRGERATALLDGGQLRLHALI